jgi:hypothetical protein
LSGTVKSLYARDEDPRDPGFLKGAVGMVFEHHSEYPSQGKAINEIDAKLGRCRARTGNRLCPFGCEDALNYAIGIDQNGS